MVAKIMDQLHEEHRNIARLLAVLERELALFDSAEKPDYDVLNSVADYFLGFPERGHHPKENAILARLREMHPEAAAEIGDLEGQHEHISELAERFRDAITNVLRDAEMPRAAFHTVVRDFVAEQRKHMQMEEKRFFPLAERVLNAEDWKAIEAAAAREQDPLFGPKAVGEFARLYADIIAWENENRSAAG
jgi:hemerythrin-like domain-containing protein